MTVMTVCLQVVVQWVVLVRASVVLFSTLQSQAVAGALCVWRTVVLTARFSMNRWFTLCTVWAMVVWTMGRFSWCIVFWTSLVRWWLSMFFASTSLWADRPIICDCDWFPRSV